MLSLTTRCYPIRARRRTRVGRRGVRLTRRSARTTLQPTRSARIAAGGRSVGPSGAGLSDRHGAIDSAPRFALLSQKLLHSVHPHKSEPIAKCPPAEFAVIGEEVNGKYYNQADAK